MLTFTGVPRPVFPPRTVSELSVEAWRRPSVLPASELLLLPLGVLELLLLLRSVMLGRLWSRVSLSYTAHGLSRSFYEPHIRQHSSFVLISMLYSKNSELEGDVEVYVRVTDSCKPGIDSRVGCGR